MRWWRILTDVNVCDVAAWERHPAKTWSRERLRGHLQAQFFRRYWLESTQQTTADPTRRTRSRTQFYLSLQVKNVCMFYSTNIRCTLVKYTTICIAHFYAKPLKCAHTWITQFYLQITPCLPLLPSRRTSPPFGWYSFYRPTEGRRLSRPGWLVTYRNKVPPPGVEPGHGHPSHSQY